MPKNHRPSLLSPIKWISKKYINLENETLPYPCKIIGTVKKNNSRFLEVQLSGQAHTLEVTAEKIIEFNLFEYFSPNDKKIIFLLGMNKQHLQLSECFKCNETGASMIALTDKLTGNKMTILASDASQTPNLIEQTTPSDANKIGFLTGLEYAKSTSEWSPEND